MKRRVSVEKKEKIALIKKEFLNYPYPNLHYIYITSLMYNKLNLSTPIISTSLITTLTKKKKFLNYPYTKVHYIYNLSDLQQIKPHTHQVDIDRHFFTQSMSTFSDHEDSEEGFHFDPTDEEVIKYYLIPKLKNELRENFIVTKDVYSVEPWLLKQFMENEWYYFVRRTQVSNKTTGCGKNTKRGIVGNTGNWNACNKQDIIDEVTGNTIGIKQTLKFVKNSNKRHKTTDDPAGVSQDSWIMKEFSLPEGDKFQELVLCRIQKKIKDKHDHVYEQINNYNHEIVNQGQSFNFIGSSASTSTYHHGESSSSFSKQHQLEYVKVSCSTPAKQSNGEGNIPRCENPNLNTPPLSHEPSIECGEIDWNILSDPDVREFFNN